MVEPTFDRFISDEFSESLDVFEDKIFGNIEGVYSYSSNDDKAFPTRGMYFSLKSGIIKS